MPDFPIIGNSPGVPHIIHTMSPEALGMEVGGTGLVTVTSGLGGNIAHCVPFRIASPFNVLKMFWENGSPVSGNIDVGIYTANGDRVVSSGAVAQSGTGTIQIADITDTLLLPGKYYMALVSNVGVNVMGVLPTNLVLKQAFGVLQQAAAYPLPNPIVFAKATNALIPLIGISGHVTI